MIILPTAPDCPKPDCPVNINAKCPGVLRTGLDQNGANLGCVSSCIRGFGQEKFGNRACCSGTSRILISSETLAGSKLTYQAATTILRSARSAV